LAEGFLEFTANQGIQGRSGNFTFNPGNQGKKKDILKIREVIE